VNGVVVGWVRASCGNKIPQRAREAIQGHWLALGVAVCDPSSVAVASRHGTTCGDALLRLITVRNINICPMIMITVRNMSHNVGRGNVVS
jgi:hypothetical protein